MNHDCTGDMYEVNREKFYRCFADGRQVVVKEMPKECPLCDRPTFATKKGKVMTRKVTQVLITPWGWLTHEPEGPPLAYVTKIGDRWQVVNDYGVIVRTAEFNEDGNGYETKSGAKDALKQILERGLLAPEKA